MLILFCESYLLLIKWCILLHISPDCTRADLYMWRLQAMASNTIAPEFGTMEPLRSIFIEELGPLLRVQHILTSISEPHYRLQEPSIELIIHHRHLLVWLIASHTILQWALLLQTIFLESLLQSMEHPLPTEEQYLQMEPINLWLLMLSVIKQELLFFSILQI